MAVEIKELIVRARVDAAFDKQANSYSRRLREDLVRVCVDQVLEILDRKSQR